MNDSSVPSGITTAVPSASGTMDRELPLTDIAEAYRLMDAREALKVLIRP